MRRVVVPEMLDALSPEAREAQRSRRDLVRINGLMGNQRWLMGVLANRLPGRVVEIGSGDGTLASALVELGWRVTAVDLSPKPASCAAGVDWVCGDLRDLAGDLEGDVLIGNLVWHHFQTEELRRLAGMLGKFHGFLVSEPWRGWHARMLACTLIPFVNGVTRHDMFVSITAGFRCGELPEWLGLEGAKWKIEERGTALGAYRLQAWRV